MKKKSARGKRRQKALDEKKQRRAARFAKTEGTKHRSKYARKRAYLLKTGQFGFEVAKPKPW